MKNILGKTTRALAAIGVLATCVSLQGCNSGAATEQQPPVTPPVTPPPVTDTTAPSVPANVTAAAESNTRIDVSWSASADTGGSGLSGYRVYRDGAGAVLATVNAPGTTYADSGLAATTQYSYVVRAFDVAGNESSESTAATATTQINPVSGVSGLDARMSNTTCLAWDEPTASSAISLEPFTALAFDGALGMVQAPADNSHWYVIEQGGAVKRFTVPNPANATTLKTLPVTSGGETGLLGIAFHPSFPTDKRIFFSYTATVGGQLVSKITSFTSDDNGATLNATETPVLTLNQPEANHNGGNIAFGPDGFLYIGFGDGGGGGDTHGDPGNGQRLTTMLGKMLRIDVSPASGYNIPPDNPFAGNPKCGASGGGSACPEIYAWGFRNPWRWSFDRSTNELWVGDVGQDKWEEVDLVQKGGNYGWRCREGAHDFASSTTTGCGSATLIEPLAQYGHELGNAITGGFVYRGTQSTPLKGRFIFADSGTGRIWAWVPENAAQPLQPTVILDNSGRAVLSFGQGNDGELYVVDPNALYHVVFQPASGGGTAPTKLSDTGCVNPADPKQPAAGLIPYAVNAPFWSDGATKERWIGLPDGTNITVGGTPDFDWNFPNRTVLMKNFRIANKLIETRLFMRHPNGNWGGFTYEWNAQQTDATLLKGGAVRDIGGGQQWIFPSESQCLECHTAVAGRSLGLETRQLNRNLLYPQTGRNANELFTLNHIMTLTPAIPDPAAQPPMPDPVDTTAPLDKRARAYLHTNCSQCHRAGGTTSSNMDLRYTAALTMAETETCNVAPQSGDLGLGASARLIVPGNAGNSILVNRMNRRDANGMPRLGSNQVDATGVALITQWINGLTGC